MAIGLYGIKKLATVSASDVDVLYAYSPDRESVGDQSYQPLFSSNISTADFIQMLGADGMYKLRLPANIMNKLGFYSILIQPKQIQTVITDCSYIVSSDSNNVTISNRGIVIPSAQFPNSNLIGYIVQYFDTNGNKINGLNRIVTSSSLVSVSTNNTNNNIQGAMVYTLDNSGTNLFLTLSPDENNLISNATPVNIGIRGQTILLNNTGFDPISIEVEMTDTTIKSLGFGMYSNSTRDLGTGVYTIFDDQNRVYRQYNIYTQKLTNNSSSLDIKEQRTIQNPGTDFASITQGLSS
jgi:hypothetical protein